MDSSSQEAVEADACFAVILQGPTAWAGVVLGINGVRETLRHLLVEGHLNNLVSLDDPMAWSIHGIGDGRPYWHWWFGYAGGSATVQRLTAPLPAKAAPDGLREMLSELAGLLTECASHLHEHSTDRPRNALFAQPSTGPTSA